jgi:hypothetical protein
MKPSITKDEAAILAYCLEENISQLAGKNPSREQATQTANALWQLKDKLDEMAFDQRRQGRTSINSFSDTLKRVVTRYTKKD